MKGTRLLMLTLLAAALSGLGGCGVLKLPQMPVPITPPTSEVAGVRITDQSPLAAHYQVLVTIHNPNDTPLPISASSYTLNVQGRHFIGDFTPQATLPASGTITVSLPAVIKTPPGTRFAVSGSLQLYPPGDLRHVLYDLGVPQPRVKFTGSGEAQLALPAKPVVAPQGPPVPTKR